MEGKNLIYAQLILPIKFEDNIYYSIEINSIPENLREDFHLLIGQMVNVTFSNKSHIAVISDILLNKPLHFNKLKKSISIRHIDSFTTLSPILPTELSFWKSISTYYMCTVGEVFKAAYPHLALTSKELKIGKEKKKTEEPENKEVEITLSESQTKALDEIENHIDNSCILLHGVAGSGKTEIYLKLAQHAHQSGNNVLYLVPEIALSKQLEMRIKKVFGEHLFIYHSKVSNKNKLLLRQTLKEQKQPIVILGTRSSIFLPFNNLGLIIVDEEHDASYKQGEINPRYNCRDAAIFLSKIHSCKIVLGSSTPSLETLYNCERGLYHRVILDEKYYTSPQPDIITIDTIYARKTKQMRGTLSMNLINKLLKTVENGEQAIVFSHLRSYSPFVSCSECGEILKCPHCNVPLCYHKYNNSLSCHYCEFKAPLESNIKCPKCQKSNTLQPCGAGSEKIEEELKENLPNLKIARYDADSARKKGESEKILKDFAQKKIDILVGTQMLSKGFDFSNVTLVAVVQTDTILAQQDFRGDERALQLLTQLMGRCGRRDKKGMFVIQTNNKNHPVIEQFTNRHKNIENYSSTETISKILKEREMFKFPPFVRYINITLRNRNIQTLSIELKELSNALKINMGHKIEEISSPFVPKLEKIKEKYQMSIGIKLLRNKLLHSNKQNIYTIVNAMGLKSQIIIDVDPM